MRYFSTMFKCALLLVLLHHLCLPFHAVGQGSSNPACILNSCAAFTNQVSFNYNGSSSSIVKYCCADFNRYPVMIGNPYEVSCTCSLSPSSYDAVSGNFQVYFGEFAASGGCDSSPASHCPTCCMDASSVAVWGMYTSSTLNSTGIDHPDRMSLIVNSWKCPGQVSQSKTVTVAYSLALSDTISWDLESVSNNVQMTRYDTNGLFLLYTTGTPNVCYIGAFALYYLLQQAVDITQFNGTWPGYSFITQPGTPPRPNDCYRVHYLQLYNDSTAGASGMSVQVIYVLHDTTSNDMFWPSETAPVILTMEPITGTTRLQMQLPADPNGVNHTLSTIYSPGDVTLPVQLITLHGIDSKCNAHFRFRSYAVASEVEIQPTIGNLKYFAIRLYSAPFSGGRVTDAEDLASTCTSNSSHIILTTFSGLTGTCFPWVDGIWSVVQFDRKGVAHFYPFEDSQCQIRAPVSVPPSYFAVSIRADSCSLTASMDDQTTYALLTTAHTLSDALATLEAYRPQVIVQSSTGGGGGGGGTDDEGNSANTNGPSKAPFPITTIGIIVGVCVVFILAAFLCWCYQDTRTSAIVHPVQSEKINIPCYIATEAV